MASEGDAIASVLNKYAPNEDKWWVLDGDDLFVYDSAAKERITKVLRQAMSRGLILKMPKFILNKFSRPGVKDTMSVEDRFYFGKDRFAENVTYTVASFIGSQPVGQRSVKSVDEAKTLAKQMLASAKASAKGQPVVVDVYPVVNYEPKDSILALRA